MKVVINTCYGGFGLSPLAIQRMCELRGKSCYIFTKGLHGPYYSASMEEANEDLFFTAFDVPNPNDYLKATPGKKYSDMTEEERVVENKFYLERHISSFEDNRNDPDLVRVVEELGEKAGKHRVSELKVVEIPDGVDYVIGEYDGIEHIAERHRTWS